MLKKVLLFILRVLGLYKEDNITPTLATKEQTIYELKPFMTAYERKMYNVFLKLGDEYKVIPQINAIFDKECAKLLLLIEIDDASHDTYKRKQRDQKVNMICRDAGIKLLYFHTSYPNEENYVLKRILNAMENEKVNDTV